MFAEEFYANWESLTLSDAGVWRLYLGRGAVNSPHHSKPNPVLYDRKMVPSLISFRDSTEK